MNQSRTYKRALAIVTARSPEESDGDVLAGEADALVQEWEDDARAAAKDHDDTPCLEDGRDNCNDHGTGEGQFHGRM